MWEDPIVEEIHKTREKIALAHNYDVRALIKHYQEMQKNAAATSSAGPRNIRRRPLHRATGDSCS